MARGPHRPPFVGHSLAEGTTMTRARRPGVTLTLAVAVLLPSVSGCTTYRLENRPIAEVLRDREPESVRVVVGDNRTVEVFQPVIVDDSLRGHPRAAAVERIAFPLSSVRSVAIKRFNLGKTLLFVAAVGGGVLLYDLLMSANSTGF